MGEKTQGYQRLQGFCSWWNQWVSSLVPPIWCTAVHVSVDCSFAKVSKWGASIRKLAT